MSADPAGTTTPLPGARPAPAPRTDPPGGRAAWTAWTVGASVYLLAVVHRTSLGVAGLDAAARFGIGASALSTFAVLQVLVYAAMQIPVGLLVDRLGARRVLLLGVLLMSAGQLAFAFAASFGPALAARAVIGCGDAMTFISVLRVAAHWFPAARNPLIAQLTGLVGVVGNLFTTVVLAQALHSRGWTVTFAAIGAAGAAVFALVALTLREGPEHGRGRPPAAAPIRVGAQIRAAWAEPGTRLGLWVHFTTAFPAAAFGLLWGMPYLVEGQGMSRAAAGGMLTVLVAGTMVFSLVFGRVVSRSPQSRMPLTLAVIGATAGSWAAALAWPGGRPPLWLLLVLVLVMGSNGPASLIGLDHARSANPRERLGTASGIANMGGFVGTVVTLLGVGVLLDALAGPGGAYTAETYRWALCWQFLPLAAGTAMILRLRRKVAPAG
ncbi:nitrate/nitrite transporter [Kitasatospora sp. NBC_01539]|uniref:MFS transporter n=1 Tax=Kitasatospora sp. NBC_01539 TaxID=2903577 RepID=UPI0038603303